MSKVVVQITFKVNPGADVARLSGFVKESAALWRRHGAEVSFWTVSAGEVGNMTLACQFESFEKYGRCADAFYTDPVFQDWSVRSTAAGLASWVRSNIAREIPLD